MLFVVELLFELLASGCRSTTSAPNSGVGCHVLFHLLLFGLDSHWRCVEICHCVQLILGFGLVKVMAMFKRTTNSLVSLGFGFGGKWELVVVCAGFCGFYSRSLEIIDSGLRLCVFVQESIPQFDYPPQVLDSILLLL